MFVLKKKQKHKYVASSTCKEDYVTMGNACDEFMSLNNSLKLIPYTPLEHMKLWCDNKAALASSEINGGKKLRHIPQVLMIM